MFVVIIDRSAWFYVASHMEMNAKPAAMPSLTWARLPGPSIVYFSLVHTRVMIPLEYIFSPL